MTRAACGRVMLEEFSQELDVDPTIRVDLEEECIVCLF